MLLVIDIGNTNIVFGLFEANTLLGNCRIETDPLQTTAAYEITLKKLFTDCNLADTEVQGVAMASVVPQCDQTIIDVCRRLYKREPLLVTSQTNIGLSHIYETPETLGADRLIVAVAAYEFFKTATIVIDLGTATTFDYVSADGCYYGGAISPGLVTAAEALFQKAAKLPRIPFEYHGRVIGRSTVESMQSGILGGYVAMVEAMIDKIKIEVCVDARVIATGGLASLIARYTTKIDYVDDNLLLRGLKIIFDRNLS